jgi:glycosyltransferase involved in cell wall biosynthesis
MDAPFWYEGGVRAVKRKVLMLLSNPFLPDPRVEKEAKALASVGHEVTVLAWDRTGDKELEFEGKGFRVLRVPTRFAKGRFFIGLPSFSLKAIWKGLRSDSEVVQAHDFDTLPQALVIAKMKGAKLVYDAHEHYAKMVMLDMPRSVANILDAIEARLVRQADLVLTANELIMDYLMPNVKGTGIVVMNCIDLPVTAAKMRQVREKIVLFYGGAMEPGRYVLELLEAVQKDERCILRIAGRGRFEPQVKEAANKCPRIVFLGFIDQEAIIKETLAADAVVSLLDPSNENYRIATPVKLLEAMAVGVPVITTKGTLTAKIVEEEGCGISIEWSGATFRSAVNILFDPLLWEQMSSQGRKAAESKYNWETMKQRLLQAYEGL